MKLQKFFCFRLITPNIWFLTNMVSGIITLLLFNSLWITTSLAAVDIPDNVWEEAQQNDRIHILLELKLAIPWKPEGKAQTAKAAQRIKTQRDNIKSAQRKIKNRLTSITKGLNSNMKEFKTVPLLALEVDSQHLAALQEIPGIEKIELDYPDELFLEQSVPLIGADQAWQSGYTGSGQTVVILDTGIDKTHPKLAGKIIKELCFSKQCPNGSTTQEGDGSAVPCPFSSYCDHGTHVAGIVTGVATGTKLIAAQVFSNYYSMPASYISDQLAALDWVQSNYSSINPPIVAINMSLGGGQYFTSCNNDDRAAIINNLKSVGIATIVAAGNNGYTDSLSAPACVSSAISVGATDKSNNIAYYSNSASFLDILAPGSDIKSTIPGGEMGIKSGTSMAAPHVAGAWAILKSIYPTAMVDSLLTDLTSAGIQLTDNRNSISKPRIDLIPFLGDTPQQYALTINSPSDGNISSLDGKISCGSTCVASYSSGQTVTLQASANTGFQFQQWGGDCNGTVNPLTVTMNAAKTCTATFVAITYSLTIISPSNGKVTSQDGYLDCGNQCNKQYPAGQLVKLQATANSGNQFKQWGNDCSGTTNPLTITMNSAKTCTATFETISSNTTAPLTVNKTGGGTGYIKAYLDGQLEFNCSPTCPDTMKDYPIGTQIELLAYKKTGTWGGWSGDCSDNSNRIFVTLNTAKTCTAHFNNTTSSSTTYPLTVTLSGNGQVSSSDGTIDCGSTCVADYPDGQTVTLQASAMVGAQFQQWGGACSGTTNSITVTMNSAKTCTATFQPVSTQTYPLTITLSGNGQVTSQDGNLSCGSQCSANYPSGQTVTLQATANSGNQFQQWGGACSGTTNSITVTMNSAKTCTATFETTSSNTTVSLMVNKTGGETGYIKAYLDGQLEFACGPTCPDAMKDYPIGTQIELLAYKKTGTWGGWSGDCSGNSNRIIVTLDTAKTCTAHFN